MSTVTQNSQTRETHIKKQNILRYGAVFYIQYCFQLCRLVYELSQSLHGEIHGIQSLDDMYFIGGESIGQGRVRRDHIPVRQNEIHVQRGDLLEYHGNHWDGYVLVTDLKNRKTGLIPAFKLERVYKMHNYSSKV